MPFDFRDHHANQKPDSHVMSRVNGNPGKKNFWEGFCEFCRRIWQTFCEFCQRISRFFKKTTTTVQALNGKNTTDLGAKKRETTTGTTNTNPDTTKTRTTAETTITPGKQQNGVPTEDKTNRNTEQGAEAEEGLRNRASNEQTTERPSNDDQSIAVLMENRNGSLEDGKKTTDSEKLGHLVRKEQEIRTESPADQTGEHPSGSRISRIEQGGNKYSAKEDIRQKEINKFGNDDESKSPKVTDSGFDHSSKEQQRGDLKLEKKEGQKEEKILGSAEQAGQLSEINEKQKDVAKHESFNEVNKYTAASHSKRKESSIGQKFASEISETNLNKEDKRTETSHSETTESNIPQKFVKQASFKKDDKYDNTNFRQKVDMQASFSKDDKYRDTSPPRIKKSSIGEKLVRQASFEKDNMIKRGIRHPLEEQQKVVAKQENKNGNQTSTRPSSKQKGVEQEGVNQCDKNVGPSYTDITKSSIAQASKEQRKGVHKQDMSYESHRNTRPDPIEIKSNDSGQQASFTSIPLSNQGRGFYN